MYLLINNNNAFNVLTAMGYAVKYNIIYYVAIILCRLWLGYLYLRIIRTREYFNIVKSFNYF